MGKKKTLNPLVTEVRAHGDGWAICLKQEHCKTDEPVIYGVTKVKSAAQMSSKRFNDNAKEAAQFEAEEPEACRSGVAVVR